ncbi:MAG TPA: DUF2530 domain-containing protein [Streptosporangiaceae bacterium]
MAKPVKEVPPPLEGNDLMVAATGAVVWAVALIVLLALALAGQLPASMHWWIWTCVAGVGLGVLGVVVIPWIKRGKSRALAALGSQGTPGRGSASGQA